MSVEPSGEGRHGVLAFLNLVDNFVGVEHFVLYDMAI